MYPATDSFLSNVYAEAIHQTRRLQHHACLALLCGNNENEARLGTATVKKKSHTH